MDKMKIIIQKNYFIILLICFLFLLLVFSKNSQLNAGIKNTHHDFSRASWSNGEICKPCHIPHNSILDIVDAPLWNHQLSVATYQVYSSTSLDASINMALPLGKSKLCLACHDGAVAIENHSGNTSGSQFINWGDVGIDLRNDHPISFLYDDALANQDGELYTPSSSPSGLGSTIHDDLLDDGRMECSTCHDVHVARKTTDGCGDCHSVHGGGTISLSLRIDNTGSAFCLICHKK